MPPWLLLLCQAARWNHLDQLSDVAKQGAFGANARCSGEGFIYGGTLLHEAAGAGHAEAVRLLLEAGAMVEAEDRFEMTPLGWAAFAGHVEASKVLLSHGAQLDSQDEFLMTPLATAVKEGHLRVAQLLIAHRADLNARAQLGRTPLMEAARQGHLKLAQLLLQHHCDMDATDDLGRPALVEATVKGDLKMVQLLVEGGANVFGNTKQGLPYYLTGTSQVKDYIYQQMKFSALLHRSWAMWVLAMAPLLGFVWAIAMLDVRSQRSFMRLLHDEELSEDPASQQAASCVGKAAAIDVSTDPFYQGALVLLAKSKNWRLALAFRMLEASSVLVLIFSFGMAVVWWLIWIPLHLLLYLLPVLRYGRALLASPERVLTEHPAWVKLLRTLGLMALILAVLAWHHTQCYLAQNLDLAWTAPICRSQMLPQSLGPMPFDSLRNPSLNWYDVLLNPYTSWHGASTSVTGFGMMVQPYLVTAGFVLLLLVMAAAFCVWLLVKSLSSPCESKVEKVEGSTLQPLLSPERFPTEIQPETKCSVYGTVLLLMLDLIFDLNTVYTLMFTRNPTFAFCLMLVISRTAAQHLLSGKLCHLREVLQQSSLRGMMHGELLEMIDVHGFEAAASICLTSFSYWFCIQTAWQAAAQICSILLSICSFSLFVFHRVDVERPPP